MSPANSALEAAMPQKTYTAKCRCQPRQRFLTIGIVCIALGAIMLLATSAPACPTCKDALLEGDPAQKAFAAGFGYSIVFMMSMPFLILGTFGSFAYFSIRKAQRQRDSLAGVSSLPSDSPNDRD